MTRRRLMSVGLMVLTLLLVGSCASRGGLRVEDKPAPASATATPPSSTAKPSTPNATEPRPLLTTEIVGLEEIRRTLLADDQVDTNARKVLTNCKVVTRCLRRAATVDVIHAGRPQQVVTVSNLDGFVFGGFLLALDPAGPRLVWSVSGDQLTIHPTKQRDLIVESKIYGASDQGCCPSGSRVEVYRWNGHKMIRLSRHDQEGE